MIFIDLCTSVESTESFTTGWASLVVITWNLCARHVCHWHHRHQKDRWIWSRDPRQTQTLQSPQHFRGVPFQHDRQRKMMQLFAQNAWQFGWIWMIFGDRFLYLDIFGWFLDFPSEESDFIGKRCSSQIDGPQITSNIFQKLSLQQAVGRHSNILRFVRFVTDLLGFVTFFSDVRSFRHFRGFPCLRHFAKFGSSTTISSNAPSRSQKTPKSELVKKNAFFCGFSADFFGKNDFRF